MAVHRWTAHVGPPMAVVWLLPDRGTGALFSGVLPERTARASESRALCLASLADALHDNPSMRRLWCVRLPTAGTTGRIRYHWTRDVQSSPPSGEASPENPGEGRSDHTLDPAAAVQGRGSPRRDGRHESSQRIGRTNPIPEGAPRSGSLIGLSARPHPSRTEGSRSATQRSSRTRRPADSRPG